MKYQTRISKVEEEGVQIRGQPITTLMKDASYPQAVFYLLRGKMPNEKEERLFEAMLVSVVDHGMGTTSSQATRYVMSGGNSLNTAVGAGVLALGDSHGGAVEGAMKFFAGTTPKEAPKAALDALAAGKRVPGYGHRVFKDGDPRVEALFAIADDVGYESAHVESAIEIQKVLTTRKSTALKLNIDGAMAALLLEMGFTPEEGKGIFIIGRVAGLVAQASEEKKEKPVRRVPEEDIEFLG